MQASIAAGLGLLFGAAIGWFGKRKVWTWCTRCGQAVGQVCIGCRDRDRERNLSHLDRKAAA